MDTPAGDVTVLLNAWGRGDRNAEEQLFELVIPELHKIAQCLMRRERPGHSLQATALLNETYFRLVKAREREWQSRHHFFAMAARAMRRLLIDNARVRPKGQRVPMDDAEPRLRVSGPALELAIAVDSVLTRIEATHPDWCAIVELKFFMGLTDDETGEALGLPVRTVQRRFSDARRYLFEQLETAHAVGG